VRLFFAIGLEPALRDAAAQVAEALQQQLVAARSPRAVKWVEHENVHITMRFLGEVDDVRARTIVERAREPLAQPSFNLVVGGAGAFPPSGAPRVLWIGTGTGSDSARAAFNGIEQRLTALGFAPEQRPYTPHLTLGRVREIDRSVGRHLREWLAAVPKALGTERVTKLTLYRSHLSSAGPRYETLAEVPLS
jgi:2'-5' RNA ligase